MEVFVLCIALYVFMNVAWRHWVFMNHEELYYDALEDEVEHLYFKLNKIFSKKFISNCLWFMMLWMFVPFMVYYYINK